MKKVVLYFFICCFFFFLVSPGLGAQATEESFIEAWEAIQKNDSQTLVFEKIADKHYKFKTKKLPFDGELKILNVIIDDRASEYTEDFTFGVVEVELLNLPEDYLKKHPYSYSMWQQNNTLYFNKKIQKWQNHRERFSKMRKKFKRSPGKLIEFVFSAIYYVVFLGVFIFLFIFFLKFRKRTESNIKKSFALNEETNRLLKEILDELKKKPNK